MRAVNGNGNRSEESNRVRTDTVPLANPPSAPQGLRLVTPAPYENHLAWEASADDTGISKYLILRKTLSQAPQNTDGGIIILNLSGYDPQIIGTSLETEYKDTNVEMGAKYEYTVMAVDTEQNPSEQSAPLAVLVPTALTLPRERAVLNEGETYRGSGTLGPLEGAWTGTVGYGDGSGPEELALDDGNTFTLAHTYMDDGVYSVKVRFVSQGVGEISGNIKVKVNNVAPALAQVGTDDRITVGEGETLRLAGAFTDPGADRWTLSVDYGDSPLGPLGVPVNPDKTFTLEHQYYQRVLSPADTRAENAGAVDSSTGQAVDLRPERYDYLLRLQIMDDGGATDTKDIAVGVTNVPPTVVAGPDENILRGILFTRSGGFSDPGRDTWQAWANYGDGAGEQALRLNADKTFTLRHVYLTGGSYTVAIRVEDQDGGQDTGSFRVKVKDYLLTPNAGEDITLLEGETLDRRISIGGPQDKIQKAVADYGDGSGEQTLYLNSPSGGGILRGGASAGQDAATTQDAVARSNFLTHVYADDGIYTVTVKVTDVDGDVYEDSFRAEVQNAAPAVNLDQKGDIRIGESFTLRGSFSDPGADEWTAMVDFGDGGGKAPLTLNSDKSFSAVHSYNSAGIYTVTVTVRDDDGGEGKESVSLWVRPIGGASDNANLSSLVVYSWDGGEAALVRADPDTYADIGNGFDPAHLVYWLDDVTDDPARVVATAADPEAVITAYNGDSDTWEPLTSGVEGTANMHGGSMRIKVTAPAGNSNIYELFFAG